MLKNKIVSMQMGLSTFNNKVQRRILIIAPDPNIGGSSKSMLPIAKHLKEKGYEMLVVISDNGFVTDSLRKLGIEYKINPYIVLNIWPWITNWRDVIMYIPRLCRLFLYSVLSVQKLCKISEKFQPDLVYSNSSLITCGYKVAKKLHLPHIWHIRDYGNRDFGWTFFPTNRYKMELMKDTPSISITKEINDYYNLQNTGIIVYNGLKAKIYNPKSSTSSIIYKGSYFLFLGGITEEKGCSDLINAFCEYRENGGIYDLIICGTGDNHYIRNLKRILSKCQDIKSHVHFKGHVDNPDDYMCNAKAIIVPSKHEAFGRITAEAMFNQCLIIGRDTGGTKEQLDLGLEQNGREIGLRFKTVNELHTRMHEVQSMNQTDRDSYIFAAHQTAIKNFSIETCTTCVCEYINQVINPSSDA